MSRRNRSTEVICGNDILLSAGHNRPSYHKEMYEALSKRPHKIEKYPQSYPLDRGEFWYERCKKVAEEHHSSTHSVMNQTAVKLQSTDVAAGVHLTA